MNAVTNTSGQLGTIVSWKVPAEVSYSRLLFGLQAAKLPSELATEMKAEHALRRALRDMKEGRVIRKLRREDHHVYFQFTREYLNEQEITYEKETELSLNLDTGIVSCENIDIQDQAVILIAEHRGKRMTSDLTRLIQRIYTGYSADLIPIREAGGAYFVPEMHSNLVEQTRILLNEMGGNLRSFEVRLGSEDTAESVAESMSDYLAQLITDFRASCENVDATTRRDVKERRRGSVQELRHKLELYQNLLSGYASHIGQQIDEAEQDLLRKLASGAVDMEDLNS